MTATTQTGPYIPDDDVGARLWLDNFAGTIAADPAAVGLSPADAATLVSLADAYDAAMDRVLDPVTRTAVTIREKDEARNGAISTARVYAMQIKVNRGVDDPQKIALGIHVDSRQRTPWGAPVNEPLLDIVGQYSGRHTLRYHDAATPKSSRKPAGVSHLLLFATIEDDATRDPEEARFIGAYTRQPVDVRFDQAKHGRKTATYFGRWLTAKGLLGPWSLPVSMTISSAGITPAPGIKESEDREERGEGDDLRIAA